MSALNEFMKTKEGTQKAAFLLKAFAAAFLLALAGFAIIGYIKKDAGESRSPRSGSPVVTAEERQEMIDKMSEKVSVPVVISPAQKKKMIEAMNKKAPSAPLLAPEEKAKMIEAMEQKTL